MAWRDYLEAGDAQVARKLARRIFRAVALGVVWYLRPLFIFYHIPRTATKLVLSALPERLTTGELETGKGQLSLPEAESVKISRD